jgi:hypothetical protein
MAVSEKDVRAGDLARQPRRRPVDALSHDQTPGQTGLHRTNRVSVLDYRRVTAMLARASRTLNPKSEEPR